MVTLKVFLESADANDAVALTQAQAFSEQVLKPVDNAYDVIILSLRDSGTVS